MKVVRDGLQAWLHRRWAAVCTSLRGAYVACHGDTILAVLTWICVALLGIVGFLLVACAVLWCCFVGSVASSVAVRQYMLRGIPSNQVLPVELELAPMEAEPWRWHELATSVQDLWASEGGRWLVEQASGVAKERVTPTPGAATTTTTTTTRRQRSTGASCGDDDGGHCGQDDGRFEDIVRTHVSREGESSHSLARIDDNAAIAANTLELQTSLVAALQRRRWDALLCRGLVRIRGVPSVDVASSVYDEDLFLPTDVPVFNAAGVYAATLQLVFLKTATPHRVSLSVHTTMLAAGESWRLHKAPTPPLWKLQAVFRREQGTSFISGDNAAQWAWSVVGSTASMLFCVPLMVFRVAWSVLEEGSGPFPPLATDGSEVALSVPLYQRFHPPMDLQQRLCALNLTVFERLDASNLKEDNGMEGVVSARRALASSPGRLHVVRANVAFSVQLEGLAYLLTEYPLLSSATMTGVFFVLYVLWCVCVTIGMLSGGLFLVMRV